MPKPLFALKTYIELHGQYDTATVDCVQIIKSINGSCDLRIGKAATGSLTYDNEGSGFHQTPANVDGVLATQM